MSQDRIKDRINFRLIENLNRVILDQGDEIADLKRTISEIKSYFSPKMLVIYFSVVLTQVITVTYYIAQQEDKIQTLIKQIEKK